MKFTKSILCIGLVSGLLMGCGTYNKNADHNLTGNRTNEPLGVRYNPQDNRNWDGNNMNTGVNDNRFGVNDNRLGVNNNRGRNMSMTDGATHNEKLRVADDAADRIARLSEVDTAHVIVTDRNAYVAVKLNNRANNELTKNVERKIAKEVRDVDSHVDHVYVSVNPDFFHRMTGYGNDIRSGRPVSGFFNEFTDTVHRVFPTSR